MKKIVIVDDHEIVRKGLVALLSKSTSHEVIADFSSGRDLFTYLNHHPFPDLFIIDNCLPRFSGVEITRGLISRNAEAKVVLFLEHEVRTYIINGLRSGAKGFLLKDSSLKELEKALQMVSVGEFFFNSRLSQRLYLDHTILLKNKGHEMTLSEREIDVVRGFASGLSYKQISDQLCISKKTIETHRKNIMEKLDFTTNVDIVKYAIKNKIIELA